MRGQRAGRKAHTRQLVTGFLCLLFSQLGCIYFLSSSSGFEIRIPVLGFCVSSAVLVIVVLVKLWLTNPK